MELTKPNPDWSEKNNIKSWAAEDRPREKMIYQGVRALTNAELLAILLGSGTKKISALNLAQQILNSCEYDLNQLGRLGINDLKGFKGVGSAKAVTISAAIELGRRRKSADIRLKPQIKSSAEAYDILKAGIEDLGVEEFWVLYLNRNNRVLFDKKISSGGVSGTTVDPRVLFKPAINSLCSAVILCHNHPSGNLRPSEADKALTKKLVEAGKLLDINVLDHLIITQNGYFSFIDEGLL